MYKSPLRWVGGKSKSVKTLLELIPPHWTYVEPFFGGGSLFFAKPKANVEVINDVDNELINFYETIRTDFDGFKKEFKYLIVSRHLFHEWKKPCKNLSTIQRAIRFFYINRIAFGGDMNAGAFGRSNIRRSNLCVATDDLDKFLAPIHNRLKDTYIECLDYHKIFELYDQRETCKEKREIFFFCDPPYFKARSYKNNFGHKQHVELRDHLKSLKSKFLLTINSSQEVIDLYKDFNFVDNNVCYKIGRDICKQTGELIITNY